MAVLIGAVFLSVGAAYSQNDVPGWVTEVIGYWQDDKITNQEFKEAMDYLMERGVVPALMAVSAEGGSATGSEKMIEPLCDIGTEYDGIKNECVEIENYRFGATILFDQLVYTWTDKAYITIIAPNHNLDADLIEEIGAGKNTLRITTSTGDLDRYRLVETGPNTGIFAGEFILAGFLHDADGDPTTGNDLGQDVGEAIPADYKSDGLGPSDGLLPAAKEDGIAAYFEFDKDESVVSSALVRWNLGEISWLEPPNAGSGAVRVIDPDMNWDPEAVDVFHVMVYSDSDMLGWEVNVIETGLSTGIFEGYVRLTERGDSGPIVANGDTITAVYTDHTLPNMPGEINALSDKKEIVDTMIFTSPAGT